MRPTAVLVALIVLAGCLGGGETPQPAAPEQLGTSETTRGATLEFAVPRPVEGMRYVWSFGDGESALGTTTRHAWAKPGAYTVAWQEMQGSNVVRSQYGLVRVHDPIALKDTVRHDSPSEATFEVFRNATAVELRFKAPAGGGPATVLLVDPSGTPVDTEAVELDGPVDVTLRAADPAPGTWLVYVELPEGEAAWTAEGRVVYG